MSPARKQVAVVIGATSKWQADGRNTRLAHGRAIDDSDLPVAIRWGIGGAIAQKFAKEGYFVVLTTRASAQERALANGDHACTSRQPPILRRERTPL
jgi:NAD(P)-dependent dehydrogenase (short-subunit alcohol dehydrogenase family)